MQCVERRSWLHIVNPVLRNGCLSARSGGARWRIPDARWQPNKQIQQRKFSLASIPAVLVPPVVFTGLLVTLWTYKCLMMVVFQNKIIYMPSVPPFSRSEKVADYAIQCKPVEWTEHSIKSLDGTVIKLLEGTMAEKKNRSQRRVVTLYLQGNASSLPPRLPYLSGILKAIAAKHSDSEIDHTIVALSYRGFWTSKGRPSQPGIELDTAAALQWIFEQYDARDTSFVVWGQSIGAGAASVGLAKLLATHPQQFKQIEGLILETPFVDLRAMLIALYPQKFLPYRYLAPFLKSTWDSKASLQAIGKIGKDLRVLILQAGDDEIVPAGQAEILANICQKNGMEAVRKMIPGALHTEVVVKAQGRAHITQFLNTFSGLRGQS